MGSTFTDKISFWFNFKRMILKPGFVLCLNNSLNVCSNNNSELNVTAAANNGSLLPAETMECVSCRDELLLI